MTLFVLLISVPALLFCCLALVHFQQEILRGDRAGSAAPKKISLDPQEEPVSELALSQIPSRTDSSQKQTHCEVYQIESAYLGPFFVVRAGNGRDWQLTNTCDEYHRVPSVARG